MQYPEEVIVPMDLIQRITIYHAIMASVLEGLSKEDKSFLDQRIKDLMSAEALKAFGHGLSDDITLSNLHNDIKVITRMLQEFINKATPDSPANKVAIQ